MKLRKIINIVIFTLILLIVNCVFNIDVNAEKIIVADYDGENSVTVKVTKGSYRVISYKDDDSLLLSRATKKSDPYVYYAFNGIMDIIDKDNPLIINIDSDKVQAKGGGVIKLTFAKSTNKKDTKKITINIPNVKNRGNKKSFDNTNYGSYCTILRDNYTDKNDYASKHPSVDVSGYNLNLHINTPEARSFYKFLVPDCWESGKVYYVPGKKDIRSMINSALSIYYYSSISQSVNDSDKTESWSVKFDEIVSDSSTKKYWVDKQDPDAKNQKSTFYNLTASGEKGPKASSSDFSLKCNYKSGGGSLDQEIKDSKGNYVYNIGANLKRYYAVSKVSKRATYVYNYTGASTSSKYKETKSKDVCETKCEEVVEVKYGPPVASKAGLCFEYQVQVTSRVKCEANINNNAKPDMGDYDSPYPWCNEYEGYQHQGGPNSSYEACISDCDGGKYTKSCSEKCYKSVYGSSQSNKTSNAAESLKATKVAFDKPYSEICKINGGKYVRNKDGVVYWKSSDGSAACGYARYYYEAEPDRTSRDHGSYYFDQFGFKREIHSGTDLCGDPCSYHGYKDKAYLNAKEMYRDYKKNLKVYKDAIKTCSISAKCTTKTATFSITADYKSKNTSGTAYKGTTSISSPGSSTTCDKATNKNIVLDYKGCYKNCGHSLQYHTRWSFPGTWFNYKTGEISYESKPNESWYEVKEKFCTPRKAYNVNAKWWNYYINSKRSELATAGITDDYIEEVSKSCEGSISGATAPESNNIDWNIKASTNLFGYFGWHFDISCFYALNQCGVSADNYTIRSVDSKDLFPDPDGATHDVSKAGRETGFNWSSGATAKVGSTDKNPDYVIDPPKLIAEIQTNASNGRTYDDEYLDYGFELDKDAIASLRKLYSNYTEYKYGKGIYPKENGVSRYYSYIIHGGKGIKVFDNPSVPSKSAIFCNNMINYKNAKCYTYK